MERSSAFRDHGQRCLFEPIGEQLAGSEDYRRLASRSRPLLVLGDRLDALFRDDDGLGNAARFARAMADADEERRLDGMLHALEGWLKAALRMVRPEVVERWRRDGKRDNLFDVLKALELVPHHELEFGLDEAHRIPCPIRRAIFTAKELRNPETHHCARLRPSERENLRTGIAATVVATLSRHETSLRAATQRLLLPLEDSAQARRHCSAMAQERNHHLSAFGGREEFLTRLDEAASKVSSDVPTSVVVLHGPQGQGKSALVAQWTQRLAARMRPGASATASGPSEGPSAPPWLPGPLIHLGKVTGDPRGIAHALLWQANALLLEPVAIPRSDGEGRGALRPRAHVTRRSIGDLRDGPAAVLRHPTFEDTGFDVEFAWSAEPTNATPEQWCLALFEALERLVRERGPTILVVDAVDEILRTHAEGLEALPVHWPPGMLVVLTVRTGPHLAKIVERWHHADTWPVSKMTPADVAALLNLEPEDTRAQVLAEKTSGWPPAVRDLLRQIQAGRPVNELEAKVPDQILGEMAARWSGDLESLLLALALLEPCAGLRLEDLKSWWADTHGRRLLAPALRRLLEPVQEQLSPLADTEASIRLVLATFGEYLRTRYFVESDLREGFEHLLSWVARTMPDNDDLIVGPLLYWSRQWRLTVQDSPGLQAVFEALHATVPAGTGTERDEREEARGRRRKRVAVENEPLFVEGLRHAVRCDLPEAMAWMGEWLLDGDGLAADPVEGVRLLRRAADQECASAMSFLGSRLLDGRGVARDPVEGELWLRRAADDKDVPAMIELGWRLLDGHTLTADSVEGEIWLRRAADEKDDLAMYDLGLRLLNGDVLNPDAAEGEMWLRRAADERYALAMWELGVRLLDGHSLTPHPVEGEMWLRRAAEEHDKSAMLDLGKRLLHGRGLTRDPGEGEKWVDAAINGSTDSDDALYDIAMEFYLARDLAAASSWFRRGSLYPKCATALLYMWRRGQLCLAEGVHVDIADLIAGPLAALPGIAAVNIALCHAAGLLGEADWAAAASCAKQASDPEEACELWSELAAEGDGEGDLVVAWMAALHGLPDPDGLSVADRLSSARERGWAVPADHAELLASMT